MSYDISSYPTNDQLCLGQHQIENYQKLKRILHLNTESKHEENDVYIPHKDL